MEKGGRFKVVDGARRSCSNKKRPPKSAGDRSQRKLFVLFFVIPNIMKTTRTLLVTALGLLPVLSVDAASTRTIARAEVNFFEPEKFTDVRDSYMGDYDRTTYLDSIREHVLEQAKYYVPEGHKLSVTFTDIDMAGDFEPWRGPRFDDIRIVKDIYPPRISLAYRLTDAEGNVVKEGKRELRDLSFMMKITMAFRDDPVRHEKDLLDDWLRSEFQRVRNS